MKSYEFVTVGYQNKDVVMASVSEHRTIIKDYADRGVPVRGDDSHGT